MPDLERPRRRKRWFRLRNLLFAKLLFITTVIAVAGVVSYRAKPGPPVDFAGQLRALTLSRQPASGDDGFPAFERAAEVWRVAEARAMDEAWPPPDGLVGVEWAVQCAALDDPNLHPGIRKQTLAALHYADQAGLFRELDAVAAAPRIVWPKPAAPLLGSNSGNVGRCRGLVRVCVGRMHLAASRGDWDEFSRAFEHALAIGRVADNDGMMLSRLVGTACYAAGARALRGAIADCDVPEATLTRALSAMDAVNRPPVADAFEAERFMLLELIQLFYTDDGKGDGMPIPAKVRSFAMPGERPKPERWHFMDSFAVISLPWRKEAVAKVEELASDMKAHAELPMHRRASLSQDLDRWVASLPDGLSYIGFAADPYDKVFASHDQFAVTWRGTRLLLGVEIHRRRHARCPGSLSELVPDILAEIPEDPYNVEGFRYATLAPGESPDGAEYLLYTMGADHVDDAGRPADPEHAAFSASKPDGDFRFNSRPK